MRKIDQTKITPQILEKIKEVNDEAGYRTHLEVAEMIRIVCEVVDANYDVSQRNLMNELTEGLDALKERRNMERERLDERLGKRDRVDQEETFAPHMDEEQYINIHDLVKDFARLIDIQKKEIETLTAERDFLKSITDKILREFPVGNIAEHTIESIPDRISYYLKELAEYTQKAEDLEEELMQLKGDME